MKGPGDGPKARKMEVYLSSLKDAINKVEADFQLIKNSQDARERNIAIKEIKKLLRKFG